MSNKWWSSLIWQRHRDNPYSGALYAHPLALRAEDGGLGISYPAEPRLGRREYMYRYERDLEVGLEGLHAPSATVAGYSDWALTAEWRRGDSALRATFGHGLPYVYFEREGSEPAIVTWDVPGEVHAEAGPTVALTIRGHHYALFAPSGATWERTATGLRSSLGGKHFFSVAVLPDAETATLALYRKHAFAFVRDTKVTWHYDERRAELVTRYDVSTDRMESGAPPGAGPSSDPIVAMYRHQWLSTTAADLLPGQYASPRGMMKTLASSHFETSMRFYGVLPVLPNVSGLALAYEVGKASGPDELFPVGLGPRPERDTYWEGKSFGRLASLLELAHQQGMKEVESKLLQRLKNELTDWFDGRQPRFFYYDPTWRTLVGFPASYGSASELNDHHFHYGYFVRAAETIARFDPAWASTWAPSIELLIKDVANWDRADTRFPFLRYMDVYAGHSWASGPADFPEGNNEEASSEDINLSYSILMWGANTGNLPLRDLGIFLYANQVAAAEQYWFDVDQKVFPPGFRRPAAGMVWGAGAKYDTWFDQDPVLVQGINYLPVHGGSLYFARRPDAVRRGFDALVRASHGEITTWRDYVLMVLATADAERALTLFNDDTLFDPEFGNSMAMTRHWLFNMRVLGKLDTTVTADTPTYAVFVDGTGKRTHVAYNGGDAVRPVTFSDGVTLSVEPRELLSRGSR